jgi:aspyridone synthetase trans-acting enoyl reductase
MPRQSEALPASQQALKAQALKQMKLHDTSRLPTLEDDEILVRVRCVAINPVDIKVLDMSPTVGATIGCEFAGDVVQIGRLVSHARLRVGVPVFGCVCGNNPGRLDNGAFADYVAASADLVYVLPDHLSYQQGATLGAALPTVGLALYYMWHLPLPYGMPQPPPRATNAYGQAWRPADAGADTRPTLYSDSLAPRTDTGEVRKIETEAETETNPKPQPQPQPQPKDVDPKFVLVYGGSTVSGALALQMLRKSGLVPICTCSPRNFALVRALGAEKVFDYHSPTCGDDIRRHTVNSVAYALDCIADLASMRICYAAIGSSGGKYMGLNPFPLRAHTRRDIKPEYILVYTMFGKAVKWPRPFARPARPRDRSFVEAWVRGTQSLIDQAGEISPHPIEQGVGGLKGLSEGFDRMRRGDVSGVKLVYSME